MLYPAKGYIISRKTCHIPKPFLHDDEYLYVNVYTGDKKIIQAIHRLVANTFLNRPISKHRIVTDHINGIKTDNRLENLRYTTHSINMKNALITGNSKGSKKMEVCKLDSNGKVIKRYKSIKSACLDNNIGNHGIIKCCKNPK